MLDRQSSSKKIIIAYGHQYLSKSINLQENSFFFRSYL